MAGLPMTIPSIRGQIAAAIRMIVQLQRMSDGKRRVTSVAEISLQRHRADAFGPKLVHDKAISFLVSPQNGDGGSVVGPLLALAELGDDALEGLDDFLLVHV